MLRKLQALGLIVRPCASAVEHIGTLGHALVDQTPHDLPILQDERHVAGAHLEHGSGPLPSCLTADFWEPLYADASRTLILDPGQFYILASKEAVHVPPDYAAEMVPFDPLVGEFRVHYAGFFDPGFGHAQAGGEGARAVLEVRSRDVPFILEDGQIVGRLVYERMAERPRVLYGAGAGSNYQAQGLKLSKHFR